MAATADGRSLLVTRGRIKGDDDEKLVMRFGRDRNKPLAQYAVPNGAAFAASPDGSRCVVATGGNELVLLDGESLRPLRRRKIGIQAWSMHFRSRRELLIGTEKAIFRLDPESDEPPQKLAANISVHRFCADDAGKLLAVSGWFDISDRGRRKAAPFGVRLLALPSLKPVRTFEVPGHQCVTVALSPDGKRIAFEAHDTASRRKHVVAFDVATGKEIARRRSDFIHDLAFLRDNRTLAIGTSAITKREAVELWLPGA
jgi:dipeptidyl aminopeptidase/acylaminoacyl peptidase